MFTPLSLQSPTKDWKGISRTAPDQIVTVLKLEAANAPTVVRVSVLHRCFQSDRPDQDFIYILAAVRERAENKDVYWSRLVDAGVIDALCECVLHAKTRPLDPISGSRLRIETSVRSLKYENSLRWLIKIQICTGFYFVDVVLLPFLGCAFQHCTKVLRTDISNRFERDPGIAELLV
jgi:hypothetical protein